jgi:hypothetical protein
MKLLVPEGTNVERNSDVDNETVRIIFKSDRGFESMVMGSGPLWGGGSPPLHLFISPRQIQEREIGGEIGELGEIRAMDFRVIDKDENIWRKIGFFTETISYGNVSDQAAAFFDSIIGTMCWDPLPGSGNPQIGF